MVSILLAFGIEAGWAGLVEAREGRRLLELIRDDVVAMQTEVDIRQSQADQLITQARALLSELANPSSDAELVAALGTLGSIFVTSSWNPVNHTYVEAMSSGRLRLIEDESMRLLLTRYQARIEDIRSLYGSVETQYYQALEPFLVANTIYSELAAEWWRDSLVEAPFSTDFEALKNSHELWNLVTLRLEAEIAVVDRLDRLEELADELLRALPEA